MNPLEYYMKPRAGKDQRKYCVECDSLEEA